jgi:hypothetical protein
MILCHDITPTPAHPTVTPCLDNTPLANHPIPMHMHIHPITLKTLLMAIVQQQPTNNPKEMEIVGQ